MSVDRNPLVDVPPHEIPLRHAPLVRVIAQVRFPLIASIDNRGFIAPFQEAIRDVYPVLRQEMAQGFVVGPQGLTPAQAQVIWRFHDIDGHWRVSLAPDFLALETTFYQSRQDFLARLLTALRALNASIKPQLIDRIGLRYIDRIGLEDVENLRGLVRPEVVGILATPMAMHAQQALSETLLTVPDTNARIRARWGRVPPRGTVDPDALEPLETSSWILDFDMFSEISRTFDPDALIEEARMYAERIYTLFRWAVTDEFLRRYGGDI